MKEELEKHECPKCSSVMKVISRGCDYEEYIWWCESCGTLERQGMFGTNTHWSPKFSGGCACMCGECF